MKRTVTFIVAALAVLILTAGMAVRSTRAQAPPQYFTVPLAASAAVPPCAAAVASGAAGVAFIKVLNQSAGTFEVTFLASSLPGTPTAAHIHLAPAGVAGPVVLGLPITSSGPSFAHGSTTFTNPGLLATIQANPSGHYLDVHSALCAPPTGVVRGQLR
jgi:hypothetical protein